MSGGGHQPRRLGAALGIALGVRRTELTARRAEVLPALGRVADAVGHTAGRRRRRHTELFGERRAVDGKVKGTAQLRVGEGVGQMVVEHTDRLRQRSGLPLLVLRHLLDGRVGQLRGVVQLAGKQLIVVRLRVRLEAEANAVRHDELALVIFAVSLRLKLRGLYPCAHGIGAVRHDVGGRRPACIPLHQITAQRGRRRRRADAGDEVGAGPAERHEKGALALGLHAEQRHVAALAHLVIASDHAQKRGVGRCRRGIDQALPGVNEVLRRHALAVRPAGRGAQRERIGHGVVVILFLDVSLAMPATATALPAPSSRIRIRPSKSVESRLSAPTSVFMVGSSVSSGPQTAALTTKSSAGSSCLPQPASRVKNSAAQSSRQTDLRSIFIGSVSSFSIVKRGAKRAAQANI